MKIVSKLNYGFAVTAVLPFLLGMAFALHYYSGQIRQEARTHIASDVHVAELMYQAALNDLQNLATYFANEPSLKVLVQYQLVEKLADYLVDFGREHACESIEILPPVVAVEPGTATGMFTRSGMNPRKPGSGITTIERNLTLFATAPITGRTGEFLGTLMIRRRLDQTALLDDIARATGANVYTTIPSEEIHQQIPGFVAQTLSLEDPRGASAGAFVLWRSSKSYDAIRRRAVLVLIAIGALGLGCIAVSRHLLLRAIIAPILTLKRAADRVGGGDYAARAHFSGYDEIGELGDHFNHMVDYIDVSHQQLRDINRELEQTNRSLEEKIEARTRALMEQNDMLNAAILHLKETRSQMIVQEKLASLGELTAGIAHEIKNPLNVISSFAQILPRLITDLQEELAKDEPDQEELAYIFEKLPLQANKILEHGQRAADIINRMLEHSHMGSGERKPTDINLLVKESVKLAYHGIHGKHSAFHIAIQEDYDAVLNGRGVAVVPHDIGRVMINIILNAGDAMRQLHTEQPEYAPTLTIRTALLAEEVAIYIRDNGPGIPPENLQRIFQPFFTTKPTGEGTGLGLSLCYDIITVEHLGTLKADSRIGEFAEFTILLPVDKKPEEYENIYR